ncbi:Isochorismatase hydrolase [Fomitiporia mediterranea MF3/22]|uniref:Isochorismatase hydrolase n=1 Tax=Fomitiporia mediterranea (strain MF3/22) TaxID=694068 RepID=UPI0004408EFE|nr:Isochorismatase hydrolase [Fomitiporia mediterranea MF3/22]EJD07990.1 Isochorismatase hydrolase [Fomitiporia mediterranea MF3/22]
MAVAPALIVVDVQYDFLPGGSLGVTDGDHVLHAINHLLSGKWSYVAASQDYHPTGHVSFASTHNKELFSQIDVVYPYATEGVPSMIPQVMWPDHCVQGTRGAEIEESILESLQPWFNSDRGQVFQKGTDPLVEQYSAFACNRGVSPASTHLTSEFRKRGINTLFVVGLATDYCVRATALDARKAGFGVKIIGDAVRAVGGDDATRRVEAECKETGIEFVGIGDEVVKEWLE